MFFKLFSVSSIYKKKNAKPIKRRDINEINSMGVKLINARYNLISLI